MRAMGLNFRITAIRPTFGAIVEGFQVADLDDATFPAIEDLFNTRGLLVFRDQRLTPAQYAAFARRFPHGDGPLVYKDHTLPGFPEIQALGNYAEGGEAKASLNQIGIEWHTDGTSRRLPCVATMIHAVQTPRAGGDTLFCSGYTAYDLLDAATRARIDGARATYNLANIKSAVETASDQGPTRLLVEEDQPDVVHPLVRTHPVTGRKALWTTYAEVAHIDDLSQADSVALIHSLLAPGTRDEHIYAHHYLPGDLVVWDNRCMLHSTTPYTYRDEVRLVHRIALNGPEPLRV
ncbi:TauD/TfdA dioxygenase family protein [Zavarzinia sp. CC-PAN008]|uniref:TauD/TfdA dioxygenase family protein n=1 Tax=Zavarzinia sp. CC-PAN008 TaxID=3243332 RepID=UPI003F74517E